MDNPTPHASTMDRNSQQVFVYPGNPNGHVYAPSPAICLDTVGNKIWWKFDGANSNTGWQ